jgi:hypothetical protein
LELEGIHLIEKTGGKSGVWRHPRSIGMPNLEHSGAKSIETSWGFKTGIITLSDRCAKGEAEDRADFVR